MARKTFFRVRAIFIGGIIALAFTGCGGAGVPVRPTTTQSVATEIPSPTPEMPRSRISIRAPTPDVTSMPTATPVSKIPELDVQTFVRIIFIHGVPYKYASEYGSADVPILLAMLQDPREYPYWPNIVAVLGIIGDEKAVDPLISFLQKGEGILSREQYVAKTAVLMSLGYLINKNGSQDALRYLEDSLDPLVWEHRKVIWESPFASSMVERDQQLISTAVIGLALSGHPMAREALLSFQQGAGSEPKFKGLTAEALGTNEVIARKGLIAYYSEQ